MATAERRIVKEQITTTVEKSVSEPRYVCTRNGVEKVSDETSERRHKPDCEKENARIDGADRWYMLTCDCGSESEPVETDESRCQLTENAEEILK